ncbi:hypothetical protein [Desulfoferrobacter suflitae]|uniref:hypothetical protein n=1 Tax=Desulfoferrobacter suflitae TaxID=2865782 RepID=UPI002164EB37|nr:hypothetical protein [Desulfoferrobacter suflitae]MCK8603915.1 hypothetical protein [Desulfoferrobacter suflitae]
MVQSKFSIDEKQADFLNTYRAYGFKDKSSMLREAIEHFKKQLESESLRRSADLYAEVYAEDRNVRELTAAALAGWPE